MKFVKFYFLFIAIAAFFVTIIVLLNSDFMHKARDLQGVKNCATAAVANGIVYLILRWAEKIGEERAKRKANADENEPSSQP
ncbi:MAG TPA: hypothetical protein VNV14_07085 [Opitutaceae bacterium]|jgi:hypothetical protein|nr:hypothetical protein [Opitutaceae bacterium]